MTAMVHDSIPRDEVIYPRLQQLCLAFPETVETENFGSPWFRAGKRPFCVYGRNGDDVALGLSTSKEDQSALCAMGPFRPTPYMHQHGWTTYDIPAGEEPDWDLLADLLDGAYRNVALKRMIQALDS